MHMREVPNLAYRRVWMWEGSVRTFCLKESLKRQSLLYKAMERVAVQLPPNLL